MRWIVCALLAVVLATGTAGCVLNEEQAAALTTLDQEIVQTQERLAAYEQEVAGLIGAIERKEIPLAEGTALIAKVQARWKEDLAQLKELQSAYQTAKEEDLPFWYWALLAAGTVAGAAGTYFPIAKPLAVMLRAVIAGVEASADAKVKATIRDKAISAGVESALNKEVKNVTG